MTSYLDEPLHITELNEVADAALFRHVGEMDLLPETINIMCAHNTEYCAELIQRTENELRDWGIKDEWLEHILADLNEYELNLGIQFRVPGLDAHNPETFRTFLREKLSEVFSGIEITDEGVKCNMHLTNRIAANQDGIIALRNAFKSAGAAFTDGQLASPVRQQLLNALVGWNRSLRLEE